MTRALPVLAAALLPLLAACETTSPERHSGALDIGTIPWIDVHSHLAFRPGSGNGADSIRLATEAVGKQGLKMIVLMSPPQSATRGIGDEFLAAARAYPGIVAFAGGGDSLNPMIIGAPRTGAMPADLRNRFAAEARKIAASGAKAFGELSAHHLSLVPGHVYEEVPADHPLFLLLADIAAETGLPIDLHLDPVTAPTPTPSNLSSFSNPPMLAENIAAFERLLAHNRQAKIVWAHAGSDQIGHWTAALSRTLLSRHPNLYMSLRLMPGRVPQNNAMTTNGNIVGDWLAVIRDFPDRFVIGGDQFFVGGNVPGAASTFARLAPMTRDRTQTFLRALPPDLARKVGIENAVRLYRLTPPE